MYPHHTESMQRVTEYFERDPEVLALLLGGSIAHGFETAASDIDILIFVSEADYQKRFAENRIHFFTTELATYEGGYVDGKYSTQAFVRQVIEKGSEPARFAFAGSRILINKLQVLLKISAGSLNIPALRRRNASNVSMPSSKPGIGIAVKLCGCRINICLGLRSASLFCSVGV